MREIKSFEFKKSTYCELIEQFSKASVRTSFDYEQLVSACYKAMLFLPQCHYDDIEELLNQAKLYQLAVQEKHKSNMQQHYSNMHGLIQQILFVCHNDVN